jgi:hypothetical protein
MAATETTPIESSSQVPDEKIAKAEFKRTAFDREFRLLTKQAQETIQARYGMTMELGESRPELICLNRYINIYNSMTPEEHYCYFETLYNRNRSAILNCLKDDRWIRTGRLNIQFGEGFRGMEQKCKQIRIMLSDIFLIACDLQSSAEKALDGIDEKFAQAAGGKDLIRPTILLLHLMRIFYHLNDGDDKVQLGSIVTQLENDLGVTKKTVGSEPWKAIAASSAPSPSLAAGGLTSIFTMATDMMERMGYKPPPEMKPPTESEISNVISSVFNSDVTQSAIQNMFTGLQDCQDFGSAIQHVVKNVTDPTTMEAIQGSVMQTAQFATSSEHGNAASSSSPQ